MSAFRDPLGVVRFVGKATDFSIRSSFYNEDSFTLPCGQCIGCRLARSREWALRCMHENRMHEHSCFLTLTYDEDHLPLDLSLDITHFQKFMKRLRKKFSPLTIRYYHCGEYGDLTSRPHYHVLIFGLDFSDKKFFKTTSSGSPTFTSDILTDIWGNGFANIGSVSYKSAGYCARYCLKKINGEAKYQHYLRYNADGTSYHLSPEYNSMSRRPGLGRDFYDKFSTDLFPEGQCVIEGRKVRVPRYYDGIYEIQHPIDYAKLKERRRLSGLAVIADSTLDRLSVRESCLSSRLARLPRSLSQE